MQKEKPCQSDSSWAAPAVFLSVQSQCSQPANCQVGGTIHSARFCESGYCALACLEPPGRLRTIARCSNPNPDALTPASRRWRPRIILLCYNSSPLCRPWAAVTGYAVLATGPGRRARRPRPTTKTPKYSNEFLNLGAGARSLGMGKTQVSPGQRRHRRLLEPRRPGHSTSRHRYDGVLMHSELFSGVVKNDYAAFAMPLDEKSAIGVSAAAARAWTTSPTRGRW